MRPTHSTGVLCALTIVFGSGCGRMLNGKIYSLADNSVMSMQIETSYGHGKMTAYNANTGERFKGTYAAVRDGQTQAINGSVVTSTGGVATVAGTNRTSSNLAKAIATLIGDQGTTLDCQMEIQPGLTPHGIGTAKDQNGREYRIQF